MCSNDCFFVRTSWLEAKQGNRRRAEARGSAALGRSGEHPDLERAEMKGQASLCNYICERVIHSSFIHSTTSQHFLSTHYVLGIRYSTRILYVLTSASKSLLNKCNLGKQPFMSQLEI